MRRWLSPSGTISISIPSIAPIGQLKVSDELRPDQVTLLSKGLLAAFKGKGLRFHNDSADLVIQYIYELKDIDGPQLESTKVQRRLTDKATPLKKDETLTINIRDIKNDTDVWRLTVTRRLSPDLKKQADYNEDIANIIKKYPPEPENITSISRVAGKH